MHASLNSSVDFEVQSASFVPEHSQEVRSLDLSPRAASPKKGYFRYVLTIIIKFIFASTCDRDCQKEDLGAILIDRRISPPPLLVIGGVKLILPKPLIGELSSCLQDRTNIVWIRLSVTLSKPSSLSTPKSMSGFARTFLT